MEEENLQVRGVLVDSDFEISETPQASQAPLSQPISAIVETPEAPPSPEREKISLKLYSFNSAEIGEMLALDEGILLKFPESIGEKKEILLPTGEIKAANVARVGRIGMDNYVMRVFIALPLAARLRKELEGVKLATTFGAQMTAQTFSAVTGEHADFYINSRDVFGVNARGGTAARRFMNVVNRTTPEHLKMPD